MTTAERLAWTNLSANKQFFDAIADKSTNTAIVGTVIGVDGYTGRTIANVADGIAQFNSIANSSQQGITSSAFANGIGGASGYNDGRSA